MQTTRKLAIPAPAVACFTAVLALSFVMTVTLGIWMSHVAGGGDEKLFSSLRMAHLASGFAFIGLGLIHLFYNRQWLAKVFAQPGSTFRLHAEQKVIPLYIAAFFCVVISAVLMACGVSAIMPFHCGSALLFSVLAIFHITLNLGNKKNF